MLKSCEKANAFIFLVNEVTLVLIPILSISSENVSSFCNLIKPLHCQFPTFLLSSTNYYLEVVCFQENLNQASDSFKMQLALDEEGNQGFQID